MDTQQASRPAVARRWPSRARRAPMRHGARSLLVVSHSLCGHTTQVGEWTMLHFQFCLPIFGTLCPTCTLYICLAHWLIVPRQQLLDLLMEL